LGGRERTWTSAVSNSITGEQHVKSIRAGQWGNFVVKAALCTRDQRQAKRANGSCAPLCPCSADPKIFEILSDLLVEGWVKAAQNLSNRGGTPLILEEVSAPCLSHRFDPSATSGRPQQGI
jgi:hypothetical protein